jgi:hypothetical protein
LNLTGAFLETIFCLNIVTWFPALRQLFLHVQGDDIESAIEGFLLGLPDLTILAVSSTLRPSSLPTPFQLVVSHDAEQEMPPAAVHHKLVTLRTPALTKCFLTRWTFPQLEQAILCFGMTAVPQEVIEFVTRNTPKLVSLHLTTHHDLLPVPSLQDKFPATFRTFRLTRRGPEIKAGTLSSWLLASEKTLGTLFLDGCAGLVAAPDLLGRSLTLPKLSCIKLVGSDGLSVGCHASGWFSALVSMKKRLPALRVVVTDLVLFREGLQKSLGLSLDVIVTPLSAEDWASDELEHLQSSDMLRRCRRVV